MCSSDLLGADHPAVVNGAIKPSEFKPLNARGQHLLLDPRTLKPTEAALSVTIVSRDGTLADTLSKAVFVLGPADGLALLDRSADLDTYAATAAEYDGRARIPHQYFLLNNGAGIARAENQLLLWKGYQVNEVIRQGLAQMWAEGPGGSHYQIMIGRYSQVGCGIFVNGSEISAGNC